MDRAGSEWEALAARLHVKSTFPGWLDGDARQAWLARASVAALPSTWPEPFGLVGLEAAAAGRADGGVRCRRHPRVAAARRQRRGRPRPAVGRARLAEALAAILGDSDAA